MKKGIWEAKDEKKDGKYAVFSLTKPEDVRLMLAGFAEFHFRITL